MAPCHSKAAPQLCLALHAPSSSNPGKSPQFGAEQRRTEPTQMEDAGDASSYSAHSTGRCRWGGSRGFSPPARTHAATLCEVSVYSLSLFLQNYTSRNYAKSNSKAYRLKQQTARKYLHLVDSTLRNYWEVNLSWSRTPTMWSKQGIRLFPGQGRNKILSRCSLSEHRSFWALNRAWIMQKKMVHDRVIKDCHKINT